MNGPLAIIQNPDSLWLRYLRRAHDYGCVIDLNDPSSGNRPHHNNIYQWRRWLLRYSVRQVHFWQPSGKCWAVIAAARLCDIPVTVCLTGRLPYTFPMAFKLLDKFTTEFNCAGNFIADQLYKNGIAGNKITVTVPTAAVDTVSDRQRIYTRQQISSHDPVILALAGPDELSILKPAVWTAAMLKHAIANLRLVVAGNCSSQARQKLQYWQRMWDSQGMIYFADEAADWDQLVAACDVVLVASSNLGNGTLRLLHACLGQKPIVATAGQADEYLKNHKLAHLISDPHPRHTAAAALTILDAIPQL